MISKKCAVADKKRCVACGACTKVCPRGALHVHHGCYAVVDKELCVGCGVCAKTCPADCITVKEREEA